MSLVTPNLSDQTNNPPYFDIPKEILLGLSLFVICEILTFILKKYVIPYVQSLRYRDIDLTGTWTESYVALYDDEKEEIDKQEQDITLKLVHAGTRISGTAELRDNHNTIERVGDRDFKVVNGGIKNGYVSLSLEIINPTKIGVINYLLKVEFEGDVLNGLSLYYNSSNERISPCKSKLKRKREGRI